MPVTLESLGIDRLSVREKLDLIEQIWDSLPPDAVAEDTDVGEIPAWHVPILEQRLAEMKANPGAGTPWREALDKIEGRLVSTPEA